LSSPYFLDVPTSAVSELNLIGLAAVINVSHPNNASLQTLEIADNLEGEQETLPELPDEDFEPDEELLDGSDPASGMHLHPQWSWAVESASKGVSDMTDMEYQQYVHIFKFACICKNT